MGFCVNCGTKLPEGAKYCPECGKAVNVRVSDFQTRRPEPNHDSKTHVNSNYGRPEINDEKGRKIGIISIVLGVLSYLIIPVIIWANLPITFDFLLGFIGAIPFVMGMYGYALCGIKSNKTLNIIGSILGMMSCYCGLWFAVL